MEQPTSQKFADYAFGAFFAIAAVIAAIDLGQRIHDVCKGKKKSDALADQLAGKDNKKEEKDEASK
jgi:hypothetical protein